MSGLQLLMSSTGHTWMSAHLLFYSCFNQPISHTRILCPLWSPQLIWVPAWHFPGHQWSTLTFWKLENTLKRRRKYFFDIYFEYIFLIQNCLRWEWFLMLPTYFTNPSVFPNLCSVPLLIIILINHFLCIKKLKGRFQLIVLFWSYLEISFMWRKLCIRK